MPSTMLLDPKSSNASSTLIMEAFVLKKSVSVKWSDSETSSDMLLKYFPIFANAISSGSSKISWTINQVNNFCLLKISL